MCYIERTHQQKTWFHFNKLASSATRNVTVPSHSFELKKRSLSSIQTNHRLTRVIILDIKPNHAVKLMLEAFSDILMLSQVATSFD